MSLQERLQLAEQELQRLVGEYQKMQQGLQEMLQRILVQQGKVQALAEMLQGQEEDEHASS